MATIKIMNQTDITGLGSSVTKVASPSGNATTSYLMSGLAAPDHAHVHGTGSCHHLRSGNECDDE